MQDMASQFQCGCESCSHWRVSLHENLTGLAMLSEADCSIVWMDYIQPSEDRVEKKEGSLSQAVLVRRPCYPLDTPIWTCMRDVPQGLSLENLVITFCPVDIHF